MIYALTSTQRTVGWVLAVLVIVAWVTYLFINIRSAKPGVGSEYALASNRGNLPQDEDLEGKRIEIMQFYGVVLLLIIGLGLPFYWLKEPGRIDGAIRGRDESYIGRGDDIFQASCADCHGADGGGGATTKIEAVPLRDDDGNFLVDADGEIVVHNVNTSWTAPAVNTVMSRFSREEVLDIVTFGRPNTPMPPWGLAGGASLHDQQLSDLLDYLESIQIPAEDVLEANIASFEAAQSSGGSGFEAGEWLFGQQCARCHTAGWSQTQLGDDSVKIEIGEPGGGRFGPRLTQEGLARQFLLPEDQEDFIAKGSNRNASYGEGGNGSGRMPGFGDILTAEQISAIVAYERGLNPGESSQHTESSTRPELASDETESDEG